MNNKTSIKNIVEHYLNKSSYNLIVEDENINVPTEKMTILQLYRYLVAGNLAIDKKYIDQKLLFEFHDIIDAFNEIAIYDKIEDFLKEAASTSVHEVVKYIRDQNQYSKDISCHFIEYEGNLSRDKVCGKCTLGNHNYKGIFIFKNDINQRGMKYYVPYIIISTDWSIENESDLEDSVEYIMYKDRNNISKKQSEAYNVLKKRFDKIEDLIKRTNNDLYQKILTYPA